MSGAESASTNFVVDGNVRDNAFNGINFETPNKIGAVVGYPGPNNGVAAAAGNPGPKIVMKGGNPDLYDSVGTISDYEEFAAKGGAKRAKKGGNRSPSPGPNYLTFTNSPELEAGVYRKGYAPVVRENNNFIVGGKKRRRSKYSKKVKKPHKKSHKKFHVKSRKKVHVKSHKKANKKSVKKRKTIKKKRGMLTNLKKMLGMKGGNPANFTPDTSVPNDRQYMTNQEFTNSYSQGGKLAPLESALANPTLTTPTNNC
jgi:hypothetical protein